MVLEARSPDSEFRGTPLAPSLLSHQPACSLESVNSQIHERPSPSRCRVEAPPAMPSSSGLCRRGCAHFPGGPASLSWTPTPFALICYETNLWAQSGLGNPGGGGMPHSLPPLFFPSPPATGWKCSLPALNHKTNSVARAQPAAQTRSVITGMTGQANLSLSPAS